MRIHSRCVVEWYNRHSLARQRLRNREGIYVVLHWSAHGGRLLDEHWQGARTLGSGWQGKRWIQFAPVER